MFVSYLDMFAGAAVHRRWKTARRVAYAEACAIPEATEDAIICDVGSMYFGFVLQSVVGLHRGARHQRFYPAFVGRFHGLSQMGMDLMSAMGFMMPSTSYDRAMKLALESSVVEYKYNTIF